MEWFKSLFGGGKPQEITIKNSKSPTVGAIVKVVKGKSQIRGVVGTGTYIGGRKVLTDARLFKHYEWNRNNFAESGPKFVQSSPGYVLYFCMGLDKVSPQGFTTDYNGKCKPLKDEYYLMRGFTYKSSFRKVIKKDKFGRPEQYAQWKKLSDQSGETARRSRAMKNNRKAYALAIGYIKLPKDSNVTPYPLSKIISPNKDHRYEIMGYDSKRGALNQWDVSGTLQVGHNRKSKWSTNRGLYHIDGIKTAAGAQGGPIFEKTKSGQKQIGIHMGKGDVFFNDDILKAASTVGPVTGLTDRFHAFGYQSRSSQSLFVNGYVVDGYNNRELWMGGIGLILFALVVLVFFVFGACCGFVIGKKVKAYEDKKEEY